MVSFVVSISPDRRFNGRRSSRATACLRSAFEREPLNEIILYWSKEDQAFIADVPELPGCAADGATYQEAPINAELVMREWIQTANELGRPVPEPRGRLIYA